MRTIQEIMGLRKAVGDLGIEIETESREAYAMPTIPGWRGTTDGSLRDFGIEYISKGPIKYSDLAPSLKNWKDGLGGIHRKLRSDSISTSVHIHVNMQELTPLKVLNFYLCSVLFENVMANFAGPDRIGNLFCLRTVDAEDQYDQIRRQVVRAQADNHLASAFGNNYKYSNVNTMPVGNFGSIEHRVMRGTTDINEILLWSQSLYNLREFSNQFNTPVDIVRAMKELGPDGLLQKGLAEHADQFKYSNWERDLLRNFIYVADMATCRTDWDIPVYQPPAQPEVKLKFARLLADPPENGIVWDEEFEEEDM